jgi:hypothetical protein
MKRYSIFKLKIKYFDTYILIAHWIFKDLYLSKFIFIEAFMIVNNMLFIFNRWITGKSFFECKNRPPN